MSEYMAAVNDVDIRRGDKLRASWSEKVYLKGGGDVLVSTALETEALSDSLEREMKRLTELMANAHVTNIEAARSEQ